MRSHLPSRPPWFIVTASSFDHVLSFAMADLMDDTDPAAEFLAQEQTSLAGIAAETLGLNPTETVSRRQLVFSAISPMLVMAAMRWNVFPVGRRIRDCRRLLEAGICSA